MKYAPPVSTRETMKEHMGFMQRTPAEKADWGSTLIIGNIHEMRQSDLDCIRIIVNDEHKRRIDGQPTPAGAENEANNG